MSIEIPNEVKYLSHLIDYTAGFHQRFVMHDGTPAKGELTIEGRDSKAIEMVHAALVFLQSHMPTIERSLERDTEYANSGKRFGGGKR